MFNLSLSEQSAFYLGVTDTTIKKKNQIEYMGIQRKYWIYNEGYLMYFCI